jgi:predicted O-methyltransferase YrrM
MTGKPLGPHNDTNPFNPDCRDPSRYHITRAGATELEVCEFIAGLVRALQPRGVIETGTADADTTIQIGTALHANKHGRAATIDISAFRVTRAKKRLGDLPVSVFEGEATTFGWDVWQPARDRHVDLVFIDGGTNRGAEFANVLPHLAPNALTVWHDVANDRPVARVVRGLVNEGVLLEPLYLPTPRGLAVARLA